MLDVASTAQLIIGPWAHAETVVFPGGPTPKNYRLESLSPSILWFDRYLRPSKNDPDRSAPVRIYVMGLHVWRDEQEWPLARTEYRPYYLQSGRKANGAVGDGALSLTAPVLDEPYDTYLYDPMDPVPTAGGAMIGPSAGIALQNSIELRGDGLVYSTSPLQEDLEVTGPIQIVLHVSTSVGNTDFTGKLVDVYPDGSAYNISDGILRRPYPKPDDTMKPDRPAEIKIALWPTSMGFLKGHRLRVEISSSNYPRFDRNPNTGGPIATETDPISAVQKIYHGLNPLGSYFPSYQSKIDWGLAPGLIRKGVR